MDIVQLLEDARATLPPSQESVDDVRSQLLAAAAAPARPTSHSSRRRRWVVAAAASAVVLASAAATYVALRPADPKTAFGIQCGSAVIGSQSGDPLADCRQAMIRDGIPAQPLSGWITPTGVVAVLPQGQAPPVGSRPLPVGFEQDRSLLFVENMLGDEVSPLATQCTTRDDAAAYARRQLGIAGLVSWTVRLRSSTSTKASGGCVEYTASADPVTRSVFLIPQPAYNVTGTGKATYDANRDVKLDRLLHAQLAAVSGPNCLTLADAASLVKLDLPQLGIPGAEVTITQAGTIQPSGPTCATPAVDPAGGIQVTLWALPPSTPPHP